MSTMDYSRDYSNEDAVEMKENQCYDVIGGQLSRDIPSKHPSMPSFKRAKDNDKVNIAILLLSIVIVALLIIVLLMVALYAASNIPSQLNTLQEELVLLRSSQGSSSSPLTSSNTSTELLTDLNMKVDTLATKLDAIGEANTSQMTVSQSVSPLFTNFILGSYIFDSCAMVALSFPSGMYWIRSSNGTAVQVYCSSPLSGDNKTAGWRRVAFLDTSQNDSVQCPDGLEARSDPLSCRRALPEAGCSSVIFSTQGISYSCILGRITGRQSGHPDAFNNYQEATQSRNSSIDGDYVDGVSLTYGTNPRRHIWTLASGIAFFNPIDCTFCDREKPTAVIGNYYSCEINMPCNSSTTVCNGPLWDGDQCVGDGTFYRQLPQPTTEDIEMRVCRDQDRSDEDILITFWELYVI